VRMNRAESIYINSGLRTKRLRRSVIPKLIALGGRTEGLEVLDVGCGPGECVAAEIEEFGASRVTAIDFDPRMVHRARARLAQYGNRVTLLEGDVTNLPYENGTFDAVFNFAVLHHVPDWKAGLQEIARVLKVGGRLFSQDHDVANHDWLSRHLFEHPPDRFTNVDFLSQVASVGLRPLEIEDRPGQLLVAALKHEECSN
jgi:ubiquinone/menaquinone biosynthesis C-methylase UbiE